MSKPLPEQLTFRISADDRARIDSLHRRGIRRATILRIALRLGLSELESERSEGFLAVLSEAS